MARTVLVCTNVDCAERGSEAILYDLMDRAEAGDLGDVDVRDYLCFSACEKGPNIVCVEDQVWYCGVAEGDVTELAGALRDDTVVDRLTEGTDSITRNLIFSILEAGLLPGEVG